MDSRGWVDREEEGRGQPGGLSLCYAVGSCRRAVFVPRLPSSFLDIGEVDPSGNLWVPLGPQAKENLVVSSDLPLRNQNWAGGSKGTGARLH